MNLVVILAQVPPARQEERPKLNSLAKHAGLWQIVSLYQPEPVEGGKMELSIDFECPQCRKVQPLKVADLSPGRRRICHACGTATELTEGGLAELARHLREFLQG